MASSTVEDYVKQLYMAQHARDHAGAVATGKLATAMGVTPGTATVMVKGLAADGLVRHEPRRGVELTAKGESLALDVIRRHRMSEQFLVEILGMDWATVHKDAEVLEHVLSEPVVERMDAILGSPDVDPHGDPIPNGPGHVEQRPGISLAEGEVGLEYRVDRITNQEPDFLRFIDQQGLMPATIVAVLSKSPDGCSMRVMAGGTTILVQLSAASDIRVSVAG